MKKVFVSYCHRQGEWVFDRLVPCLKAGGDEVLIDRKRFEAGRAVFDQMDQTQDEAEIEVLVLSPDYVESEYCRHEMERAIAADPDFQHGRVIPVMRVPCDLPGEIRRPNPLRVNLTDDHDGAQWDLLLRGCGAELGAPVPDWLEAREQVRRYLQRGQSVNLVVKGEPRRGEFLEQIRQDLDSRLAIVDLNSGAAASRRSLVAEILKACGAPAAVPPEPEDLPVLHHRLSDLPGMTLCLRHFDRVGGRNYGLDFFSALKHLVDCRKLVLLVESRAPYSSLLPPGHILTKVQAELVELRGR
jgi:hypothetical protein